MEAANLAKRIAGSPARWGLLGIPAIVAVTLALVATSTAAGNPASARPGELYGVAALTSINAWTVGDYLPSPGDIGDFKVATQHRKGTTWGSVGAPSPSGHTAALASVASVSATNVWGVGQYNATDGNDRTLIEHWNGSRWAVVASPNPGTFGNALNGVSAAGATVVWAVGYQVSDAGPRTLVEHWDGRAWSIMPSIDPSGSDDELAGVSAVSADDAWAVGYANSATGDVTLVEHWDGRAWSVVPSPSRGGESALADVSFDSSTDGWAVGSKGVSTVTTLVEHWDGRAWTLVKSPNLSGRENLLLGVSARASQDAYAVGYHDNGSGHLTLVLHWDGTTWSAQ